MLLVGDWLQKTIPKSNLFEHKNPILHSLNIRTQYCKHVRTQKIDWGRKPKLEALNFESLASNANHEKNQLKSETKTKNIQGHGDLTTFGF
jgi:hypothetical protein